MAKRAVAERPAGEQTISRARWSNRELSEILYLPVALRDRRDPRAERFWQAVDCFGLTAGHPIERRRLRREATVACKREYTRLVRARQKAAVA